MKTSVRGILLAGLLGIGISVAEADIGNKVVISAQKKRSESIQGHVGGGGSKAKDSEKDFFEVKVENQTLGDLSQIKVDYVIFVERQKLGQKMDQPLKVDRVSGTRSIDMLTNREPKTVNTDEFTLAKQNLVGGWTYDNGGRIRAEDSVVGVWVRVSSADGQVIGEYTNPPTVTRRGWDTK